MCVKKTKLIEIGNISKLWYFSAFLRLPTSSLEPTLNVHYFVMSS